MTDKRGDIVNAALTLVRSGGLASLTQPRVAALLDLRQSHVTYYFPTRDELVTAVATEAVQQRIAVLDTVRIASGLDDRLDTLVRVLLDPGQTRVLLALTQIADTTPELASEFQILAAGITPAATALLHAAGAAPTPEAVTLVQTTATGLAVVALATGQTDPAPLTAALSHLLRSLPRADEDPT